MSAKDLPRGKLAILCLVIVAEPISLTILSTILVFLVRDLDIAEPDVGYFVGLITSAFNLAQLLTTYLWGRVSDRIGRKPVLILGLGINALTTFAFGLSHSLIWAVGCRALCGFFNANLVMSKSILGDLSTEANRGAVYAYLGLIYGMGSIIGPFLGAFLSWPTKAFPSYFGSSQFFKEYPYSLPCILSSILSLIGLAICLFYLNESCPNVSISAAWATLDESEIDQDMNNSAVSDENLPLLNADADADGGDQTLNPKIIGCVVSYAMLAFQEVYFAEFFPLWVSTKPPIGLGWTSKDVGMCLAFTGICSLVCQLFFYPSVSRYIAPIKLFRIPLILLLATYISIPLLSSIVQNSDKNWTLVLAMMGFKTIITNFLYTSVLVLVVLVNIDNQLNHSRLLGQCSWNFSDSRSFCENCWANSGKQFVFLVMLQWHRHFSIQSLFRIRIHGSIYCTASAAIGLYAQGLVHRRLIERCTARSSSSNYRCQISWNGSM
jgi:MFS family permease